MRHSWHSNQMNQNEKPREESGRKQDRAKLIKLWWLAKTHIESKLMVDVVFTAKYSKDSEDSISP